MHSRMSVFYEEHATRLCTDLSACFDESGAWKLHDHTVSFYEDALGRTGAELTLSTRRSPHIRAHLEWNGRARARGRTAQNGMARKYTYKCKYKHKIYL